MNANEKWLDFTVDVALKLELDQARLSLFTSILRGSNVFMRGPPKSEPAKINEPSI